MGFAAFFIFWLITWVPPLKASVPPPHSRLILAVGETRLLPVPPAAKIFLPRNHAVSVRDLGTHIELRALRSGSITVRAGHQVADVLVMRSTGAHPLEPLVRAIEGLTYQHENGTWHIQGELWRFEDWRKLSQSLIPGSYHFEARMDPEVQTEAHQYFLGELRRLNFPLPSSPLDVPEAPRFGHLRAAQSEALQALFARFGLHAVTNDAGLSLEPLIRLRVLVAEINQAFSRQLGLDWQAAYQAKILPNPWLGVGGLVAQLSALEQRGRSQILASPNLVCRSGGEANFMAGGEIPIRMASFHHNEVQWRRHGVLLQFKPLADASGHMTMALTVEVSMLDNSVVVDGVPGLKTNRIESQLNFTSNKTIVLSGLLRNEWGQDGKGLPGLQNLPILGALFRSHDYHEGQSQLVVFVTPELEPLEGPAAAAELPHPWRQPEVFN